MTRTRRIRLGYQIPNFTYPGGPEQIFNTVAAQAQEAEASGFDTVLVMDHFYQLPMIGKPEEPMLEAYTTLGALSAVTDRIQLSTLVTGNTYRNPALLAKIVTTLDVISGGRAVLAIGAGWYELEHDQMGYEFGTFTDRFERLGDALDIIEPMLQGRTPDHDGRWYQAYGTLNQPQLRTDLPIMLGGSGEKKTFGLAARYADHLNLNTSPGEIPRKLEALARRCEEAGRDRSELETSFLAMVIMDENGDEARRLLRQHLAKNGIDLDTMPDDARRQLTDRLFVGSPDDVADQLQRKVIEAGIDGVIINLLPNGHLPGTVEMAGKALSPLVAG